MVYVFVLNGLCVICDVVYNYILLFGLSDVNSVLDKIVSGYYYRRNFDGFIEVSMCCNNMVSEYYMMDCFIVDDFVYWVKDYKVDGFWFDLMGYLMLFTMFWAKDAF